MGDQKVKRSEDKGKGVSPVREMPPPDDESTVSLLRELVNHLRKNRTQLREEWARRITAAKLLGAMSSEEMFAEATSVYDNYVEVLETGAVEALQAYARDLSERIIPRGVETDEVVGIVLLLRDVLARSLFAKYQTDFQLLNRILDEDCSPGCGPYRHHCVDEDRKEQSEERLPACRHQISRFIDR